MEPRIETLLTKRLIGKRIKMSLAKDKTYALWQSFMPQKKDIKNSVSTDLFSVQVFNESFNFTDFNANTEFEKWAAVEVCHTNDVPLEMEIHILNGGLYAVFLYKGSSNTFHSTFDFIFNSWLPKSEYELDNRDHFAIMGDKYKNNDPTSEEEIWIPIKRKG